MGVKASATLNRLASLLSTQTASSFRACGLGLLGAFAAVELVLIRQGAAPINEMPWDVIGLLDGAWRIVCGQIPHTDFHSPLGALTYLLVAFGMRVTTPSASSISYGIALLLALLLPWAWILASRRLPAAVALAFVFFLGFLLAAPRPLSFRVHQISYAMLYNREGYVLLSMLLLSLFVKPRSSGRYAAILGGLSIGVLLGLMLHCKITYFILGACSVPIACAIDRQQKATVPAAIVGLTLTGMLFAALFHISLRSYLSDIAAAAQSQSPGMRLHLFGADLIANGHAGFLIMLCLMVWAWTRPAGTQQSGAARLVLIALWIFAVAMGVASGNATLNGTPEDPIYVVAGIITVELSRRQRVEQPEGSQDPQPLAYVLSLLLILPLVAVPILARDMASFGQGLVWNLRDRSHYDPSRRLHSAALADFLIPDSTLEISNYWPARDDPANINDGIDLLRRNLRPGDRVTTLTSTNPFSFALGLQPARDGPLWWDLKISFNERHHPSADSFLGSASLVMVLAPTDHTQGDSFPTSDLMLELYSDYLQAHFQLLDRSEHWILYRRRGVDPVTPLQG